MPTSDATFAARLRGAMLEQGVTVRQLAEDLGVHERTVEMWRQGTRQPSDHVVRLARRLAKPADYFYPEETDGRDR